MTSQEIKQILLSLKERQKYDFGELPKNIVQRIRVAMSTENKIAGYHKYKLEDNRFAVVNIDQTEKSMMAVVRDMVSGEAVYYPKEAYDTARALSSRFPKQLKVSTVTKIKKI